MPSEVWAIRARAFARCEPDLIEIPAGDFLYGNEKETRSIAQSFAIARYPVTVAQFGLFMADGGYEEPRYWGGTQSDGWQWRMKDHGPTIAVKGR